MVTNVKVNYENRNRFSVTISDNAMTNYQIVTLSERRLRSLRASIDAALRAYQREATGHAYQD